jgi:molybdopterin converting factor small subunit
MSTPRAPAGHFTILYFALASTLTGKNHEFLPAPLPTCELYTLLEERYPGIKSKVLDSCMLTVNLEYVDLEEKTGAVISEGDEVGIIPPVSSG